MIPKILHQIGRTTDETNPRLISWEERRLAKIAQRIMPDWKYYLWTDALIDSLFEEAMPHLVKEYNQLPFQVIKIDIARCLALHKYGGIYFDTDYRFFQEPDARFLACDCVLGYEPFNVPKILGNAFMASSGGCRLWIDFVEDALVRFREGDVKSRGNEDDLMHVAGPDALTDFLIKNRDKYDITYYPHEVIYPEFARSKTAAKRTAQTLGVHLCWGSWRNKPLAQKIKNRTRRIISAI